MKSPEFDHGLTPGISRARFLARRLHTVVRRSHSATLLRFRLASAASRQWRVDQECYDEDHQWC